MNYSSFSESLPYGKFGEGLCVFTIGNGDDITALFFLNIHFKCLCIGAGVKEGSPCVAYISCEAPKHLPELEFCSFLLRFFRKKRQEPFPESLQYQNKVYRNLEL